MRGIITVVIGVGLSLLADRVGHLRAEEPGEDMELTRLIRALKDPKPAVREKAASEIGRRRPVAVRAIPALVAALKEDDPFVRSSIARALGKMGKAVVPALDKALHSSDPNVRDGAGKALCCCGRCAVPTLVAALKDRDHSIRNAAADAFRWMRPVAEAAVPALVAVLNDECNGVRSSAAWSLGNMGKAAVPALGKALRSKNRVVREGAGLALSVCGRCAVPTLVAALKDKDDSIRLVTVDALRDMDIFAEAAVPALVECLRDNNRLLRRHALEALAAIGPRARAAVPALIKTVQDPTNRAAKLASLHGEFISHKGPPPVTPGPLRDSDAVSLDDRLRAVVMLGSIGPDARAAVPALTAMLKDPAERARWHAAETLGAIGPAAKAAVPALIEILKADPSVWVRHAVAVAVCRIAHRQEGLAALKDSLKATSLEIRWGAVAALDRVGREALPVLLAAARDKDPDIRAAVLTALGFIGPDNQAVSRALCDALESDDSPVRLAALKGLEKSTLTLDAAMPRLKKIAQADDQALGSGPDSADAWSACSEAQFLLKRLALPGPTSEKQSKPRQIGDLLRDLNPPADQLDRCQAICDLGHLGAKAKEVVPLLRKLEKDADPVIRLEAAVARWRIDPTAPAPFQRLLEALHDDDECVRWQARDLLEGLGPQARPAVPALIRQWKDESLVRISNRVFGGKREFGRLLWKIDPVAAARAGVRY